MGLCPRCRQREKVRNYCLRCASDIQLAWIKGNGRDASKKYRLRIRKVVVAAKSKPCSDCSIQYPWFVMDFDHVRGQKKFNLSMTTSRQRSLRSVLDEIAKCDVVCANCHRIRTFTRSAMAERPALDREVAGSSPAA